MQKSFFYNTKYLSKHIYLVNKSSKVGEHLHFKKADEYDIPKNPIWMRREC